MPTTHNALSFASPRTTVTCAAFFLCAASAGLAQTVHDSNYTLSTELTELINPQGIDIDSFGNVYVSDSGRGRILKGVGGSYSDLITGIPVGPFFGVEISALAVKIAPDGTLYFGEGGRATGTEQIHHHTTDGTFLDSLDPHPNGGNFNGIDFDLSNNLIAASANRDRVLRAAPSGSTHGPLAEFINTADSSLIAPTGILVDGAITYVSFHGMFGSTGTIAKFDTLTGAVIDAAFVTGLLNAYAIDKLADGRLLVSEIGDATGAGRIQLVDPLSGATSLLVSGIGVGGGVAFGGDGSIYFGDQGTINEADGRLLRLTPVPAPGTGLVAVGTLLLALRRRR